MEFYFLKIGAKDHQPGHEASRPGGRRTARQESLGLDAMFKRNKNKKGGGGKKQEKVSGQGVFSGPLHIGGEEPASRCAAATFNHYVSRSQQSNDRLLTGSNGMSAFSKMRGNTHFSISRTAYSLIRARQSHYRRHCFASIQPT